MIDSSEKRNRQLAFELQNSHVCEKRSNSNNDLLVRKQRKGAKNSMMPSFLSLLKNN